MSRMIDLMEVTRLTREGQLNQAMAVLRRLRRPAAAADGAPPSPHKPADAMSEMPTQKSLLALLDHAGRFSVAHGLKGPFARTALQEPIQIPDGATFEERVFTNGAGSRSYKLYVPSGYNGQTLPLVVMLHGCTQSPDDFAAGTRMNNMAEEHLFLVAYPAQAQAANPSRCWNWFSASDQMRDQGEPSLIAGITREIMREFPVAPERVYVAGLSAGGAAAAIMGSTYPDLYAAVGIHSGLACGAAKDIPSAFTAMKQGASPETGGLRQQAMPVPTIVFHGDCDATVSPINGDQIVTHVKAAREMRATLTQGVAPGGARFSRTVHMSLDGNPILEHWVIHGAGHAWSGGSAAGSYTDPRGPDASREMVRFFLSTASTA